MKKFFFSTIVIFTSILVILELILRVSGIAGSTIPDTMINGEYRLSPGSHGIWVKGPQGNIRSKYSINKQGYNSIIPDYKEDSIQFQIALIGDSYIEGLHVNNEMSIGRIIEDIYSDSTLSVHEYGISGWNAHNFLEIANEIKDDYHLVFVLITEKDLKAFSKSNPKPRPSTLGRIIYNNSHTLRYLNINRGLLERIKKVGPRSFNDATENIAPIPSNYDLISKFPDNSVFLYEEKKFATLPEQGVFLKVNHIKKPINFGKVDGHWNFNGRYNCAVTIVNFLRDR